MNCTPRKDFKHGMLKPALEESGKNKIKNLKLSSKLRRHTRAVAGGISPLILNLGDGGEWSTSRFGRFILQPVPRYSLNKKMGGLQSRSGLLEKKKIYCSSRGSNPGPSSPSTLSRMRKAT
jgi:hypothetical protein